MLSSTTNRLACLSVAAASLLGACSLANSPGDPKADPKAGQGATSAGGKGSTVSSGGSDAAASSVGSSMGGQGGSSSPASCTDGMVNGGETDVDCGGPDCTPCVPGKNCNQPEDCDSGLCENKVCAPKKDNGADCTFPKECSSGFCTAEGVCCQSDCTDACYSCKQANTGQSDGSCAPVSAGKDPGDDCSPVSNMCITDTCDGAGSCAIQPAGTVCDVSYLCDGKSASCSSKCSADVDCVSGYTCYAPAADCVSLPSCAAYKSMYSNATSGMYTIDPDGPNGKGSAKRVYCDMVGKQTYESLSIGSSAQSYVGYMFLTSKVLGLSSMQSAFVALYNDQGGLLNLAPGFTSGNCCVKATQSAGSTMLTFGGSYITPCGACNPGAGYTAKSYLFQLSNAKSCTVAKLSNTFFSSNPVSTSKACLDNFNPGFFVKKYGL